MGHSVTVPRKSQLISLASSLQTWHQENQDWDIGTFEGLPRHCATCWLMLGRTLRMRDMLWGHHLSTAETNAIFRYLARKYNLYRDDDIAKANCDQILEITMDFRNGFVRLCYGSGFEENKAGYIEGAKNKLETFEAFLGDKPFFAGDKLTVCDFHMYEMLDCHQILAPSILDACPKLQQFCQRFRDVPAIKAYLTSDKFTKHPINNLMAKFL